jgi:hypothetical protein
LSGLNDGSSFTPPIACVADGSAVATSSLQRLADEERTDGLEGAMEQDVKPRTLAGVRFRKR